MYILVSCSGLFCIELLYVVESLCLLEAACLLDTLMPSFNETCTVHGAGQSVTFTTLLIDIFATTSKSGFITACWWVV